MGSGFRTFTAGEVLTASNVQNYLMDQSVMVFGGSAARSSAIGTANFEEGMVSYLTDTDKVEAYNGTNWVSVAPTSTQGLTLINTTSFSAVSSQSFNDVFSTTYDNYRILLNVTATGAADLAIRMRVSGADDSTSNYQRQKLEVDSTTVSGTKATNQTSSRISDINSVDPNALIILEVMSPFLTRPTMFLTTNSHRSGTTNFLSIYSGAHNVSTSYTGFTIITNTSTVTGTLSVYGYNK
jgi:hypothetical protein